MLSKASIEYWNEIREIYKRGIETKNATFETVDNLQDYAYWLSSKIEDSCFVYSIEDTIAGWAALSRVSSRCVYSGVAEVSVYIDPEKSGNGLGSILLNALIEYSENNNIWTLQAGIFPENNGSIALHEKFGFRKVGYREKIGKMDGMWRDTLLFERRSTKII